MGTGAAKEHPIKHPRLSPRSTCCPLPCSTVWLRGGLRTVTRAVGSAPGAKRRRTAARARTAWTSRGLGAWVSFEPNSEPASLLCERFDRRACSVMDAGVKKQACLTRRCVHAKQREDSASSARVLAAGKRSRQAEQVSYPGFQHADAFLDELNEVRYHARGRTAPSSPAALHTSLRPLPSPPRPPQSSTSLQTMTLSFNPHARARLRGRHAQIDLPVDIQRALSGYAEFDGLPQHPRPSSGVAPRGRAQKALKTSGDASKAKRPTLQRCGQCGPCTRADCGSCQNCLDKPKFGGPGLRKQVRSELPPDLGVVTQPPRP